MRSKVLVLPWFVARWFVALVLVGWPGLLCAGVEDGCVWEVKKPGSGEIFYLVGSVHMLTDADRKLPLLVDDVYRKSGQLIFEVDTRNKDSERVRRHFSKMAYLSGGQTVESWLDEPTLQKLRDYMELSGRSMGRYDRFRPWYLSVTLLNEEYARYGGRHEFGVESQLEQMARRDGKGVSGFETSEEQFRLFGQLDRATEVLFLQKALEEIGEVEDFFEALRKQWRRGDLKGLEGLLFNQAEAYSRVFTVLIKERNQRWVEEIESLSGVRTPVMIVVGVGHLLGEGGLPALLGQKGYVVKRLGAVSR
jgi:uncharacterized protein